MNNKSKPAMPIGWGYGPAADKPVNPRAMIDWPDLLAHAQEADKPLSDEELALWKRGKIDGNARMWNVQYVHAVQRALEGNDPAEMLAMMAAEIPVPAFLLPAISLMRGPLSHAPAKFTVVNDHVIRRAFDRMTGDFFGMRDKAARDRLASLLHVDEKTIARSLKKTAPKQD